jgi:two-component system LytT family response regulator
MKYFTLKLPVTTYVTFVLADNKKVLARSTVAEAMHGLPQQKFVRVHRSYVVSVNKITKVERHQVTIASHHKAGRLNQT